MPHSPSVSQWCHRVKQTCLTFSVFLIFEVGKHSCSAKESGICNASQQSPKTSLGLFTGHWEQMPSLQVKIHSTARTHGHEISRAPLNTVFLLSCFDITHSETAKSIQMNSILSGQESKKTVQICYFARICNTQKCMESMVMVRKGKNCVSKLINNSLLGFSWEILFVFQGKQYWQLQPGFIPLLTFFFRVLQLH